MHRYRSSVGFTFVELLLGIVLLGILAVLLAKMFVVGLDTYVAVTSHSVGLQRGRVGINRMAEDLWRLRGGDLLAVADTELDFLDGAGNVTNFRQAMQGGTLLLLRQGDILAQSIGYLDFDYADGFGIPVTDPSMVRRIGIELNTQAAVGLGAMTFRTEIFPRSYMYQGFQ